MAKRIKEPGSWRIKIEINFKQVLMEEELSSNLKVQSREY